MYAYRASDRCMFEGLTENQSPRIMGRLSVKGWGWWERKHNVFCYWTSHRIQGQSLDLRPLDTAIFPTPLLLRLFRRNIITEIIAGEHKHHLTTQCRHLELAIRAHQCGNCRMFCATPGMQAVAPSSASHEPLLG